MSEQHRTDTGAQDGGDEQAFVTLGRISGAHGIQGWVKVHSDTSPRENIVSYSPWYLTLGGRQERRKVNAGRRHGKGVVAKLAGCNDRSAAEELIGATVSIRRSQLPDTATGEYYWADLVGLRVETLDGVELGRIDHLFETGANDVIVTTGERERLIPYIWGQVVREVDLETGVMRVDWDPDV